MSDSQVTIKAAQSFGGMRAGEVVTVTRTSYIDGLIKRERVTVVDDAEGEQRTLPATAADRPGEPITAGGFVIGDQAASGPPKRNAETGEWAEYMAARFPDYDPTDKSRTELQADYDERVPAEGDAGDGSAE
ncbi:hypothetical protein SEA_ASHERTHEMAN_29 [Gordonia phage Ashertheman]|uniref:Uncharacterized protein n=2 Tax=Kroosvirus TaxID=2948789 RepID=A0A515MKY2_9CAUD|nr:hypothetical protein J1764_gp29 [Gordonia phage Ashertheman]YP_010002077.1 hypothetical protein J1767_gp28 [Gordonia phage Tangerine]UTN91682.1 hypothetical protein SEA_STORMINNORM_28 [Gordonia Phage StorminNorm]WMI33038.1 hypothetical protein SEA_SCHOTTB_27 [Gordonia Phage SchottB]AXQ62936.1 hypothetical protein SEA_ASHERTHEMAN_29 [Gordonia phage Ashertheman]QDM57327.1 hypothetical protein SEA_TANGERINE_28 [Gordonia phage Tangerine]